MFIKHPDFDPNCQNYDGETVLQRCALDKNAYFCRELLLIGADATIQVPSIL